MHSQVLAGILISTHFRNHLCCRKCTLPSQDGEGNLCLLSSFVSTEVFGWKIQHVGGPSVVWIQVLSLTPYTLRRQQTQVLKPPISCWLGHKQEDIQVSYGSFALVMTQWIS